MSPRPDDLQARFLALHRPGSPRAETITRLQSYDEAGADAVYAPGLSKLDDISSLYAEKCMPGTRAPKCPKCVPGTCRELDRRATWEQCGAQRRER